MFRQGQVPLPFRALSPSLRHHGLQHKMAPRAAGLLLAPVASAQPDPAAPHRGDGKAEPGARLGVCERRGWGSSAPGSRCAWLAPCPPHTDTVAARCLALAGIVLASRQGERRHWELVPCPWRWGRGHLPSAPADPSLSAAHGCCGTLPVSTTQARIRLVSPEKGQRSAAQGERELPVCHLQQRDGITSNR